MAALWGGGAGHAGAGGTLPLRGAPESGVGHDLSTTQYLLAEDLRLASVDAETILEAEELLGTMQDYLDSSVISIIEDFSSLTETKGRMDAENELSLLTTITEILDSTDDESLSPFDTIPDSELLTLPRERENSSFQRFLSLSMTPPEQDFHTIEDFQEPRICTIVTEKVEASTASFPCTLTQNCPNDLATSKKPSSKAPRGDWRLFRHKERELPVSQRSDGEEEEEEETATDHGSGFVASPKEVPAVLAIREVEMNIATSDGPYIIAPESISLSELVKSMHPYCLPTFTVCLNTESQPIAEELLACPVDLGVVPDGEKSMESSVVLQNTEAELPCRTDSNCTADHMDRDALLLAPDLKDVLPVNDTEISGLDEELALENQAERTGRATLQVMKNAPPGAKKEAQRSAPDQESRYWTDPLAPVKEKVRVLEKSQRCRRTKKKNNKSNKETMACRLPSAPIQNQSRGNPNDIMLSSGLDSHFPVKQLEKPGRRDQPLPGQASKTKDRMDSDELASSETEQEFHSPSMPELKHAEALPPTEEHLSTEHQQSMDPIPGSAEQGNGQKPSSGGQPIPLENEMVSSDVSELLPCSIMDPAGQPPRNLFSTEEVGRTAKEAKPKPLSLSEYRQRRQQYQHHDESAKNTTEKQNASKWPSLPELPTELADLPCLVVPPPPAKVAVNGLAKEPEKPAGSSTTLAPVAKTSAAAPSMPDHPLSPATIAPPSFPLGAVSTGSVMTPVPATPLLPNNVGAFPPVGAHVPPALPPPYLQLNSRAFLPASPSSYIFGSPPVPSWSHFATLPPGYLPPPPPPPAIEACPPVFHTVPPMPPPTWPPPPVSLPPFAPGLPFNSVEWAPGPQPSYWSGIPVPPPVLTIPYRDQGAHVQSPPNGTFPAPVSEETLGQQGTALQNTAVALEPSCFQAQCLSTPEKSNLPTYPAQIPSSVRTGPRRVSDPRRQAQLSAAESKAEEITSGSFQFSGKSLSPPTTEILGRVALIQTIQKSSIPQSLREPHSELSSQQARESTGTQKPLEEPSLLPNLQSVETSLSGPVGSTISAVAQSSKEASSASCPKEEECSPLSAALVLETLKVPTATESDVKEVAPTVPSALASAAHQKVPETGQLSKKLVQTWKHQPLVSIAQHSCNKDIVQAFINEIGIEASDLSSLLEQFEKTAAKKEASSMAKSRENVAAKNNGSEVQQEKKTLDRLQAPELANVAGLTPPATPPHQLWKPLAAVSLLGKAGSPKGTRLVKTLSKPHRKTLAPIHVGSGEHDYCQLSAICPKEGSRWNVKHNLDITIKPIRALTKQVPEQPGPSQTLAAVRLEASVLSTISACQNPKEVPSSVDAGQGKIQAFCSAAASLSSSSQSLLPESSSHTEPLDHRTSTPRSTPKRGSDGPCSVLLSPAASPCRNAEEPTSQQPQEVIQKRLASKRSLRCYRSRQKSASPQKGRWRGRRNRASRSFSSSSDGDSDSSSSSSRSQSHTHSPSPPSKRWRRYHSRSSSSSSCSSSWSRSMSRSRASSCSSYVSRSSSRSPSLHRRSTCRRRYDSSNSRDRYQRQKIRYKECAIEERRVVFIGKIPSRMTRSELRHRFSVFGEIEDCTLHFREQGDNYGFVTYRYAEEAFAAIEGGNAVRRPDEQPFDLCFGGRRQFCKRSYADLDSNREDFEPAPAKSKFDSLDFDTLLKQAQRSLRR